MVKNYFVKWLYAVEPMNASKSIVNNFKYLKSSFFVVLSAFVTLIFGNSVVLLISVILGLETAYSFGFMILLFPLIAGIALNHVIGAVRPKYTLLIYFICTLLFCGLAWLLESQF